MLEGIVTRSIAELLPDKVTEVRIRRGRPLVYLSALSRKETSHVVSDREFDEVLALITDRSLYAITEKLVNGYLPLKGGLRVGIAGEGVMDGINVKTVKHITSLVLRIPHQIFGIASFLRIDGNFEKNILIISPPAAGKTTLLREIARTLSEGGKNVVILDERGEIGGVCGTRFALDVGKNSDVLFGFPKRIAYENALRAMNPDYLVADELSGESDVEGVLRAHYGGVKVVATLHGDSEEAFFGIFAPLKKVFDLIVLLSKTPSVGSVRKVVTR